MIFLYVALGGALGSMARYALFGWGNQVFSDLKFPVGTFIVNTLGCLIVGFLAGLGERYQLFSSDARFFVFTGLLGGFTTFSAFGLETMLLLRRGDIVIALAYVVCSVLVGLTLLALAFYVSQKIL